MSSEYTTNVAVTNSPCGDAKSKIANDLPESSGSRVVRVCIPAPIHAEIAASDLSDLAKFIVYAVIYESATTPQQCKYISTSMLDHMPGIGQRTRRRIRAFLKSSKHFGHGRFVKGVHSTPFWVSGHQLAVRSVSGDTVSTYGCLGGAQHNSDVGVGVWCGDVVWRSVDFGVLDGLVETAKRALGWDLAEKEAKIALEQVELAGVPESNSDLYCEALKHIAVNVGRNAKNRAKKLAEARQKAKKHVAMIRLFEADPTAHIQRKAGRLYTRLSSLPRWARVKYLRFTGDRRAESVDIRCCYLWCLAAELRQRRLKRGLDIQSLNILLDLIESGGFYEELAKRAGTETSQAKRSFAVLCLFGDRQADCWGRNRLWFALDAICPLICDEISAWRRQPAGATRLATFCQRMEGAIMLDGLVPAMAEAGILCCTIHDGCLVPEGNGEHAAQVIRDRAASLFGRPCYVKTEAL